MLDRRQLIMGAASLAAARFIAGGVPAGAVQARPTLTSDPFALGVASGDPDTDSFVLWTRIMGVEGDCSVGYEIASDEGFHNIVRHGRALAPAARVHSVHLPVRGLAPGRPYFYRFHLNGAVSRTGRTRTIALDPQRLRIALTSCQHWEQGWFTAYRDMIAHDTDIVLQVGDYIYEVSYGPGPRVRSFGAGVPHSLDDYRARYALYRTDKDLADAHAQMPFVVVWDDHETENDYSGVFGVATQDPAEFYARRAASYQAYFEHMPLHPDILRPGGEYRLYRRLNWGSLATAHVLDTRQYRTEPPCSAPGQRGGRVLMDCAAVDDPSATMLGTRQEGWLHAGLRQESARWTLLTQQTLFSRFHLPNSTEARYSDLWDGYTATRDRTIAALRQSAVRNPIILGGDVHSFWVNDVKPDFDREGSPTVATEVVTSCLSALNGPGALIDAAQQHNPHVRYLDNTHSGYALMDLTPSTMTTDLRAVGDRLDDTSTCHSLARFVVEDGRPGALSV